jgi:hypothetical protein
VQASVLRWRALRRAVLGRTGSYEGVSGEVIEKNLGLNASNACNLRITFKLRMPEKDYHER